MSAPIIRRLPGFVRSFSSTSFTYAAAPAGRPYVRKSAVPTAIRSASATFPASAPSPAPTSTSIPTIDPIDLDDIPTSSYDVDDLPRGSGQSSTPIASAPLTSYPDFSYKPLPFAPTDGTTDWATSFSGMSQVAFSPEARDVLLREVNEDDVECKPGTPLHPAWCKRELY
jgi:hypothetical protein